MPCGDLALHVETYEGRADAVGPPLLLLHGFLSASHAWEQSAPAIARLSGRRALAVDLPGCGYSDRPGAAPYDLPWLARALRQLPERLGHDAVILAGHSLGGAVAVHLAALAPELVRGLVLVAPLVYPVSPPAILRPASRWPLPAQLFFRSVGRRMIDPAIRRHLRGCDPQVVERAAALLPQHLDAPGGWAAATRMGIAAHRRSDMGPLLRQVRCPALVVWGRRDPMHPERFAQRLVAELPAAELCLLDAGHNPHMEQPDAFARAVADWLGAAPNWPPG